MTNQTQATKYRPGQPLTIINYQLSIRTLILLVMLVAFAARLRTLTRFQFHIDEFFTLAAANFISQSGLPRYPTGLFYDPGLLFSYIDGTLFWLFGFSEALGRWPAVIFGTLAVATLYRLGTKILRSPLVAVLAAFWLAVSLESVVWSGRARMITLAQWLALLSVLLLWIGLTRNSSRHRLGFALSYGLTLLTHFSTVVLMPAWFVASAVLWWAKSLRLRGSLLRDGLFLLLVFALVIGAGIYFQPPPNPDFAIGDGDLGSKTGVLSNKFLQIPSDVGHAGKAYLPWFLELPHGPVLLLAAIGLAASLTRHLRHRRRPADVGALFLGAIFVTEMLVLALVISPHWQRARYLLMQVQGIFLLLGAHGLGEIARQVGRLITGKQRHLIQAGAAVLLAAAISVPFLLPLIDLLDSGSGGWNRYDLAFNQVKENIAGGDKVMSMHPPAGLLYLNQSDYYLVQDSPKLIRRPDGELGDRYSGAIWLDSGEAFSQLLAGPDKIWLVTQEFWLFNSYDGYLQQQILWQMDKQWGEGGVWALSTRPGAWPLARTMQSEINADFEGGARLAGITMQPEFPVPGGALYLTLFWQGGLPTGAKIFVHLRDNSNNTVAQADHFLYDGKVPGSRWKTLLENDVAIRDGATLLIPADLAPGSYRLMVGFYHPETFQRLPVINDQSGENGVILGEWRVSP